MEISKQDQELINLVKFLDELTELSRKYRIGINNTGELYIMESDDMERTYSTDALSQLLFE